MVNVHVVYAPHLRGKSALTLWHAVFDAQKKSPSRRLRLGIEAVGVSRAQARAYEKDFERSLAVKMPVGKNPMPTREFEDWHEELARNDGKTGLDEIGNQMATDGFETVAQVFKMPAHLIEADDENTVSRRTKQMARARDGRKKSEDALAGKIRDEYEKLTDQNVARHEVMGNNLAQIIRQTDLGDQDTFYLCLGTAHRGMEQHLKEMLLSHQIKARMKTSKSGLQETLWHELCSKRYENPDFEPSDEQLLRAHLHHEIRNAQIEAAAKILAEKNYTTLNETNTQHFSFEARKQTDVQNVIEQAKKVIQQMDAEKIKREVERMKTNTFDLAAFLEQGTKKKKR